jgi:hypothetical protein
MEFKIMDRVGQEKIIWRKNIYWAIVTPNGERIKILKVCNNCNTKQEE